MPVLIQSLSKKSKLSMTWQTNSEQIVLYFDLLIFLVCEVIAASVDSHFSHMEYTLKKREEGGLGKMKIPILSDLSRKIS